MARATLDRLGANPNDGFAAVLSALDKLSPEEREALRKRADSLGARLDKVKVMRGPPPDERARGAAFGQATKIAVELVVGVAIGGPVRLAWSRFAAFEVTDNRAAEPDGSNTTEGGDQ